MRMLATVLLIVAGATQAQAAGKTKSPKRAPAARPAPAEVHPAPAPETRAEPAADARGEGAEPAATEPKGDSKGGKAPKAKVYTFSGLDVEGKLKTPQLLYFLNRVKLELDTTGREKRSFLKELEQTSDDKGL
jgi:hypothetical protein